MVVPRSKFGGAVGVKLVWNREPESVDEARGRVEVIPKTN